MPVTSAQRQPPVRILLYVTIPTAREDAPIVRGGKALVRNRLRRAVDLGGFAAFRRWHAHYSTFEDVANSNRGDMAIRAGVR